MSQINQKILQQTHFPAKLKDIQAVYLQSPHFHDIYQYLMSEKTPRAKKSRDKVLMDVQNYMILDTLLFKLVPEKIGDGIKPLLCIPTSKIDMLLDYITHQYQAVILALLNVTSQLVIDFTAQMVAHHIRAYITGCLVCQLLKAGCKFDHPFHKQIKLNTPTLTKVNMYIKDMPSMKADDNSQWKYMLVLLCETSNFVVLSLLKTCTAIEVWEVIKHNFIAHYGPLSASYVIKIQHSCPN